MTVGETSRSTRNWIASNMFLAVLVQPRFSFTRPQLDATLQRLGVAAADLTLIPNFEAFIPDVVLVQPANSQHYRLDANGDRLPVPPGEIRFALCLIDAKHAQEPNPSYESEAVLYAVLVANWLVESGYDDLCLSDRMSTSGREAALETRHFKPQSTQERRTRRP